MNSPMSIRLIALDMDGTLLGEDHDTIPERNISALRAAAGLGVKIVIASGRTWSLLERHAKMLGVVDYGVVGNGSAVIEAASGKCLYQRGLSHDQASALCRTLRTRGIPFEVYCGGRNYMQRDDMSRTGELGMPPAYDLAFRRETTQVDDISGFIRDQVVEKVHALYVSQSQRQELVESMRTYGAMSVTNSFRDNMEFTAQGVNKGSALQVLCAQLGISGQEVMAFGDADNDVEMLSWAGWSFAMENAIEQARRAAKYQTASNDQAGVAQAVEHYVLGR